MSDRTRAVALKYAPALKSVPLRLSMVAVGVLGPVLAHAQEASSNDAKLTAIGLAMAATATLMVGIMMTFWGVKRAGQKMGWW